MEGEAQRSLDPVHQLGTHWHYKTGWNFFSPSLCGFWIFRFSWSRQGQYQNTPFSTSAAAEDEFRKIFRSKSGNDWEDRDDFVEQHKKYRLVQVEQLRRVRKAQVDFDLEMDAAPSR